MPATDEDAARQAIATLDDLSREQTAALTSVTAILHGENPSPFVDIHELFKLYNTLYFRDLLLPRVEVSWSKRLTLCAGICELLKDSEGKYRRVRLKLSEPLLKFRPRDDTVNTLLHESIHAYFFITSSWRHTREDDDDSGHGAGFQMLASAINHHGAYDITVYHIFHDEVDSYRTHVWQCDGPCRTRAPFFGLVKRSMNRAPGKSDTWWKRHEDECGGNYSKIAEPAPSKERLKSMSAKERAGRQKNKLDGWIKAPTKVSATAVDRVEIIDSDGDQSEIRQTSGSGSSKKRSRSRCTDKRSSQKKMMVSCPICDERMDESNINHHLDLEHPP